MAFYYGHTFIIEAVSSFSIEILQFNVMHRCSHIKATRPWVCTSYGGHFFILDHDFITSLTFHVVSGFKFIWW